MPMSITELDTSYKPTYWNPNTSMTEAEAIGTDSDDLAIALNCSPGSLLLARHYAALQGISLTESSELLAAPEITLQGIVATVANAPSREDEIKDMVLAYPRRPVFVLADLPNPRLLLVSPKSVIERASSKRRGLGNLLSDAHPTYELFKRVEHQLSSETEITAQYAMKLLERMRELVAEICLNDIEGRILASVDKEDRSTTIEWIRNHSRLGFSLDREKNESSWFVVLPNGLSRSGYLFGKDGLESLRGLLEEFIAAGQ